MEGGSGGGGGGSGGPESFEALAKKGLQQLLPVLLVMMAAATLAGAGRQEAQEVSFQWCAAVAVVGLEWGVQRGPAVWLRLGVRPYASQCYAVRSCAVLCCAAPPPAAAAQPSGGNCPCMLLFPCVLLCRFKTHLLAQGVVEKVEVANKSTVKVGGSTETAASCTAACWYTAGRPAAVPNAPAVIPASPGRTLTLASLLPCHHPAGVCAADFGGATHRGRQRCG